MGGMRDPNVLLICLGHGSPSTSATPPAPSVPAHPTVLSLVPAQDQPLPKVPAPPMVSAEVAASYPRPGTTTLAVLRVPPPEVQEIPYCSSVEKKNTQQKHPVAEKKRL